MALDATKYNGLGKLQAVKALREDAQLSLGEAKAIVDYWESAKLWRPAHAKSCIACQGKGWVSE